MPIFGALFVAVFNGFLRFFTRFMEFNEALKWARRTFIIALGAAFLGAVKVCVSSLLSMVSVSGLPDRFVMGLGMFIPSNAVAVLSCVGSVWLACVVYRMKLEGLRW